MIDFWPDNFIFFCFFHSVTPVVSAPSSDDTNVSGITNDTCVHTTIRRPTSFFKRHFNTSFLKKFFKHWVPFTKTDAVKMHFYLYKRDFPECGREILMDNEESVVASGFNPEHPTRWVLFLRRVYKILNVVTHGVITIDIFLSTFTDKMCYLVYVSKIIGHTYNEINYKSTWIVQRQCILFYINTPITRNISKHLP